MRIFVAEDDDTKRDRIVALLKASFVNCEVTTSKSVRSTLELLPHSNADVLLLDMSLPTFEIAAGEPGGRPQGFGGIEVMRYMERDDLLIPTVIITQHDEFTTPSNVIGLERLASMAQEEGPFIYKGLVFYNTVTGEWKRELLDAITRATKGTADENPRS